MDGISTVKIRNLSPLQLSQGRVGLEAGMHMMRWLLGTPTNLVGMTIKFLPGTQQ